MWADIGIGGHEEEDGWAEQGKGEGESKATDSEEQVQGETEASVGLAADEQDWVKLRGREDGHEYWHQLSTGVSQWDAPNFANAWYAASVEAIDEDAFADERL